MQTTIVGRSALVQGPRYDLPKVLAAHEELIDAFTARFGRSTLTTNIPAAQRQFAWPDPGKAFARQTWDRMKELYDVVDEPMLHLMEGLTVKAFLLGKTWCVRNVATGEITTPGGEHVSCLDPAPMVCVYGPGNGDGSYHLVAGTKMDAVSELFAGPLRHLNLDFERCTLNVPKTAATGATDYAFITFPHRIYGAGHDWVTVRCVNSDGSEIDPKDFAN